MKQNSNPGYLPLCLPLDPKSLFCPFFRVFQFVQFIISRVVPCQRILKSMDILPSQKDKFDLFSDFNAQPYTSLREKIKQTNKQKKKNRVVCSPHLPEFPICLRSRPIKLYYLAHLSSTSFLFLAHIIADSSIGLSPLYFNIWILISNMNGSQLILYRCNR